MKLPRSLKAAGRLLGRFLAAVALGCVLPVAAAEAPQAIPHVVVAGKDRATIVNAETATVRAGIPGLREAVALAMDDRRATVWLVDKDGYLLRYDLDGAEQLRIDLQAPAEPAWEPPEGAEDLGDVIRDFLGWLFGLLRDAHDFGNLQGARLVVDKMDGAAWIASNRTLRRYAADGTLQLELRLPFKAGAIAFDWHARQVWVGGERDIHGYGADGALIRELETSRGIDALAFDDRAGILWAGAHRELSGFDRDGTLVRAFDVRQVEHLAVGNDGSLWIAKTKTVYRYGPDGELLAEHDLPRRGPPVKSIAFEPNGNALWLNRDRELQRLAADGTVATVIDGLRGQDVITANGDITPPLLTLLEPADDALVSARPVFRLQASDVGSGIETTATEFLVDGEPFLADCTLAAGELSCTLAEDITALHPVIQVRVADFAGNPSEAVTVALRLDADADGIEDALDTYPHDPDRRQLAPVEGLTVAIDGHAAVLTWQPHADPEKTASYLVFRTLAGTADREQLADVPAASTTHSDAGITNGAGYVYEVIAVDARGNAGETGEGVEFLAAWNDAGVEGFGAARELAAGRLNWQEGGNLRYRIYRAEGAGSEAFSVLQEVDAGETTWLDESAPWHTAYRYRIATLRDFTNVFTGETFAVEGPPSGIAELPPLPPLAIALNDGAVAPDGSREILVIDSPVAISGTYSEARGPVTLTASNGSAAVGGNFNDGSFRLLLPALAGETWHITFSEQLIADRHAQAVIHFIADTAPPQITLDALAEETEDDFLLVTGTVVEDLTGLDRLAVTSDRYPGQDFGLVLAAQGRFSGEVPLANGANIITVNATDGAGNAASASHTVRRKPPLKPTVELVAPHDGLVTQQPVIDISGRVHTGLEAEQVRIVLGGEVHFPEEGDGAEGYPFLFENVPLREGYNLISVHVETPAGNATASAVVTHQPDPPPPVEPAPPELELSTGSLDIVTNGDAFYIGGSASGEGDVTVTVNGEAVDLVGGNFEYLADLAACVNGTAAFDITVTDSNGNSTTETITIACDRDAPLLAVASPGALAAPAVTTLPANPVRFAGTVTDAHLAGLTLNGTPVALAPGAQAAQYTFDTQVLLPANATLPVRLEARDTAGNVTVREFVLQVASQVGIEIIAPRADAEYLAEGDAMPVIVTARFVNFDPAQHQAFAVAGEGEAMALAMSANVGNTVVMLPADGAGSQEITVGVREGAGNVVASRSVRVSVRQAADIPLEVVRTEPANNANGIAPIDPVTIYFNKPIDPDKLVVTVWETVHGMDYDLSNQQARSFGEIPEPQLVEVHRDMEIVPGGLAFFEGDRFVSFHPERRFGYGANVYVDVMHDGEELARFTYAVQPLPTIIHGKVLDSFGNPVVGMKVRLREHGLETITDELGGYAFGSGSELSIALPGGQKTFVVNPQLSQGLGSAINQASVQQHRLNAMPAIQLPVLDRDIPFVHVRGGQETAVLDGGSLRLDLSGAHLAFPDGRGEGNIHVQFTTLAGLTHPTAPGATPYWAYSVQPAGIAVDGEISLDIEAPMLYGSLDYLPPDGDLVVIVGLDAASGTVLPVGVGVVENGHVRNVGPDLRFNRLDVIGFALVPEDRQELLARYRNGEITSLTQLLQGVSE